MARQCATVRAVTSAATPAAELVALDRRCRDSLDPLTFIPDDLAAVCFEASAECPLRSRLGLPWRLLYDPELQGRHTAETSSTYVS